MAGGPGGGPPPPPPEAALAPHPPQPQRERPGTPRGIRIDGQRGSDLLPSLLRRGRDGDQEKEGRQTGGEQDVALAGYHDPRRMASVWAAKSRYPLSSR